VGQEIRVEAHQERADGRHLFHAAEIRDAEGRVLATARGHFVAVDPEQFRRVNGVDRGA
jgi:acyl-CoA thioesterase FadM